jgi:hypothetical protein
VSISYQERVLELRGSSGRQEIRRELVLQFLGEEPGKGRGSQASGYRYYVEKTSDGRRIYLQRPAPLNKGFDFEVWVESLVDERNQMPSHTMMLTDLETKCQSQPEEARALCEAINRVYGTEEPDDILRQTLGLSFNSGFSAELVLKVLKWLFIEQDLTYWNFSGRAMLKGRIDDVFKKLL